MTEKLTRIVMTRQVNSEEVPLGVQKNAQRFFRLVQQAARNSTPKSGPASLNAYIIASDALRMASPSFPRSKQLVSKRFERYDDLVKSLNRPHRLTVEEMKTARDLLRFFQYLKQEGEAEDYAKAFHRDDSPGFPFFSSILP
jgi:hypothetical protein